MHFLHLDSAEFGAIVIAMTRRVFTGMMLVGACAGVFLSLPSHDAHAATLIEQADPSQVMVASNPEITPQGILHTETCYLYSAQRDGTVSSVSFYQKVTTDKFPFVTIKHITQAQASPDKEQNFFSWQYAPNNYVEGLADGTGNMELYTLTASELHNFYGGPQQIVLAQGDEIEFCLGAYSRPPVFPKAYGASDTLGDGTLAYVKIESHEEGCTENCHSNILFLPGFLGSRLYTDQGKENRSLWEPNGAQDLEDLAINADGTSKLPVYVGEIVDSIHNIPAFFSIYGELKEHLDTLVTQEKITAWGSYPYDWRYDVFNVVDEGTLQKDGSRIFLAPLVEGLASQSKTGKVTIVGHSNGGLLAKALMVRLQAEGKEDLVDRIIMVGTPQTGTPQGMLGLLHGNKIFPPYVPLASEARGAAASMPGSYALAPSSGYFNQVSSPVAVFAPGASTNAMVEEYGSTLDSFTEMVSFMKNVPETRENPTEQDDETPLPLSRELIEKAEDTHAVLDTWTPPDGVQVYEVVGWGNNTAVGVRYYTEETFSCPSGPLSCALRSSIDYKPLRVNDGDDTVIASSASYMDNAVYFNLDKLIELPRPDREARKHDNLTESPKFHQYLDYLLGIATNYRTDLFVEEEPDGAGVELTTVSVHSPVIFSMKDEEGNETGIFPVPDSDLYYYKEEIPNSSVFLGGEGKYISVPKGSSYQIRVEGIGNGTFDLQVEDEEENVTEEFKDVVVNVHTTATTQLSEEDISTLVVDENGDDSPDRYIVPKEGSLTIAELLTNLKTEVSSLSTIQTNQKTKLLNRIATIEKKIEKKKTKQSHVLEKLKTKIVKKIAKGKIDTVLGEEIGILLDQLLAQSITTLIDALLIEEVKTKIHTSNISQELKTGLLAKIARLENITAIHTSLNTMSEVVGKKNAKGILTEEETQRLLSLLDQLQMAL